MNELLKLGAFELAEKIRAREISPTEAVSAHVERAREVNPALNAVVEERYDLALTEAAAATEKQPDLAELPPLFGVPFTVKEMLALEGMKSTAGSLHRRDERPAFEATVVSRLRAAGAIPIATTNVPELGLWFETDNPLYGLTRNPYDLRRTPGGSSGGEGALIGAGASPFGVGSDIGGSIRMPAAFCGIAGHKPTNRVVPLTGHFPFRREDMAGLAGELYPYTSIGPLARKARDLAPLLKLMMGPDGIDPETIPHVALKDPVRDFAGRRVLVCDDPIIHACRPTEDDVKAGVRNAARLFEQYGAEVEELDRRFFLRAVELWMGAVKATKDRSFGELLADGRKLTVWKELSLWALGRGRYTVPSLLTAAVENAAGDDRARLTAVVEELRGLRAEFNRRLGDGGILLFPSHPRVAPKHKSPWLSPFDFIHSGIFNVLGNPATSVPVGLNADGLPLSVQIVAGPFRDHLTLSAAEIIEESFGGWTPPRGL